MDEGSRSVIETLRGQFRPFDENGDIPEIQAILDIKCAENEQIIERARALHARYSLDVLLEKLSTSSNT